MRKAMIAIIVALTMLAPAICSAQAVNDAIDTVGVDRFAHAGVSYIINDQLHGTATSIDFGQQRQRSQSELRKKHWMIILTAVTLPLTALAC